MDSYWHQELRAKLEDFGSSRVMEGIPISVKIRIETECFHREHSPEAFRQIDAYVADLDRSIFRIDEHETGPEILTWLAGGISLAKGVIDLVVAIVKARFDGIKKGDRPTSPVEIVVRGFKDGEYFEEKIIRIPSDDPKLKMIIEDALKKPLSSTSRRKSAPKPKRPRPGK